jgi:hypothetical protein
MNGLKSELLDVCFQLLTAEAHLVAGPQNPAAPDPAINFPQC